MVDKSANETGTGTYLMAYSKLRLISSGLNSRSVLPVGAGSPFDMPPPSSAALSACRFILKTFPKLLAMVLLFRPILP